MRTEEEFIKLVTNLSDAFGPSGFEDDVIALAKEEVSDSYTTTRDALNNLYIQAPGNTGNRPRVWLDAHSDEVGFLVQALRPDGTMDFLPLGGMISSYLPTNKVLIKNAEDELIPATIGSIPPHFSQGNSGQTSTDEMFFDVGATSREELIDSFKIRMAAPAVPAVSCHYDQKRQLFSGKAFDCRIGCAALLETLEQLEDMDRKVDIIATFTSQEEVGDRGARGAADIVDADVCICFEGCPADDTCMPEYKIQSGLRRGPMLRHYDCVMITNPRFQRFALTVAEKYDIPVQESVRKGGGTNAGEIHNRRHGVPTIVIGVPVRYIHTPHCYCTLEDAQNAIALAKHMIAELDAETIAQF